MIGTIFSYILFSALIVYLFIINGRLTRQNALLDKQVKDFQNLVSAVDPDMDQEQESSAGSDSTESECSEKPVSAESIRTVLRINGVTPEVVDTSEPDMVYFKIGDMKYRINAKHLPCLTIDLGYGLKDSHEDMALVQQAAAEVTSRMYIAKACIIGDGEAIVFSVELLCDSYTHLRNHLRYYLDLLPEVQKQYHESLEALKERRKEEREAVFSGKCFVKDSQNSHKVQS